MPVVVDDQLVRHVAHLARIELSEGEVAQYANQLRRVLEHMGQLNEVDTATVPPTAHPTLDRNVLRDDVESPGLSTEAALANAPERHGEYFRVPKVLNQDTA